MRRRKRHRRLKSNRCGKTRKWGRATPGERGLFLTWTGGTCRGIPVEELLRRHRKCKKTENRRPEKKIAEMVAANKCPVKNRAWERRGEGFFNRKEMTVLPEKKERSPSR